MNGFKSVASLALLLAVPVAAAVLVDTPRVAQAEEVILYPPAEYIATFQPEYYENRPVYWYRDRWFYRDAGGWHYYRVEPAYLRERRSHWTAERYRYHYHR